jgi:hypothetical protein
LDVNVRAPRGTKVDAGTGGETEAEEDWGRRSDDES